MSHCRAHTFLFCLAWLPLFSTPLACTPTHFDDADAGNTFEETDDAGEPVPAQRSFYMGFTPWPYAATVEAMDTTYRGIQENGDLIAHHLMEGVPWEAALNGEPLSSQIQSDVEGRLARTDVGKRIYLAADALNLERNGLALSWEESGSVQLSTPWDTRRFNDDAVIDAYAAYATALIEQFTPDYFCYASEASELILNDIDVYNDFIVFAEAVYSRLKTAYPELPFMISVALKSPGSTEARAIEAELPRLLDFVDIVGVSVYPYAFYTHEDRGNSDNLPSNWLSQIASFSGGKPTAITETGWIAEDLTIAAYNFDIESTEVYQAEYVLRLLESAQSLSMVFVVWFTYADFDTLWTDTLAQDPLAAIWRDTGLLDGDLEPRAGLVVWQESCATDYSSP